MREYLFEVCANSVESCMAAQAGGADRVELCAGIPEGGTTPSYGDIVIAREVLQNTRLHVIIRPRGGDFLYSPIEQHIMLKDIDNARRLEADGIVLGCLTPDGEVDIPLMKQLMEAAQGMSVTFHRAFDVCADPMQALQQAKELGIDTILTSGQKNTAVEGAQLLQELVKAADGDIDILIGSGVKASVIEQLAPQTGATSFHMSGKITLDSPMTYRKEDVSMGLPMMSEYTIWQTSAEEIAKARKVLDQAVR